MTTMNEQQQELNERIADDERHAATMRKARDYDALMARVEAAEALAAERLEDALFAEQRATDAELERDDAILAASDAERHAENAMHGLAHFRTRVAELEAQLAAQQWRPVTNEWPPQEESTPVRMRNGVIRWGYRHGDRWHLTGGQYSRESVTHAYALPPAPAAQETTR
jgi:hypothetical protein